MASKRFKALLEKVDLEKKYQLEEACSLLSELGTCKFDQTVDVAVNLGVDAKQSDQQVRGAVNLPHGLGKKIVVLAFAKGEKEKEAEEAGADFVGSDELVQKISDGWTSFDKVVATPDMMPLVSKVGKILGPRGLMPNPKTGTVSFEIGKAVTECKQGKVAFKTDKSGLIHCGIGKASFGAEKIKDNVSTFLEELFKLKPSSAKGNYFRALSLSLTMSPGLQVDVGSLKY